jgi:hypothetical protein
MMYVRLEALAKLKDELAAFVTGFRVIAGTKTCLV